MIYHYAKGVVESIKSVFNQGRRRADIIIRQEDGSLVEIEFHGRDIKKVANLKILDFVEVKFVFNGKYSHIKFHNNLKGKEIKKSR